MKSFHAYVVMMSDKPEAICVSADEAQMTVDRLRRNILECLNSPGRTPVTDADMEEAAAIRASIGFRIAYLQSESA